MRQKAVFSARRITRGLGSVPLPLIPVASLYVFVFFSLPAPASLPLYPILS